MTYKQLDQVLEFHHTFESHIAPKPDLELIPQKVKALRKSLVLEECREVIEALEEDTDIAHIAKELADLQIVLLGTVASYGLQNIFEEVLDEVHRSNMSKVNPDGTITRNELGKVLKPDTYSPADITSILDQAK